MADNAAVLKKWIFPLAFLFSASTLVDAEDGIDLFSMPLEDLLQVQVSVGSLLETTESLSASNVSVVEESDWQRYGARRTLEAIEHLPATMVSHLTNGVSVIAIRGYAQISSSRGIATTLDGIRLQNFLFGTAQYDASDYNLGVLQRIEMIRGPASAVYGSDAFHGVLSFHTFESDQDLNQVRVEVGDEGFRRVAARHSGDLTDTTRVNVAVATSGQDDVGVRYDLNGDLYAGGNDFLERDENYQSYTASIKLSSDPRQEWSWRWGLYGDHLDTNEYPGVSTATYRADQDSHNWMSRLAVTRKLEAQRTLEVSAYYRDSDVERVSVAPPGAFYPGGINDLQEHHWGAAVTLRQPRQQHTQWALALSHDEQEVDRADLYVQTGDVEYSPTAFQLTGGARAREVSSLMLEASSFLDSEGDWALVYGGRVDRYSDFGTQGTPRLGAIYNFASDSTVKLLYGESFRAPTAAELYLQPVSPGVGQQGNPDLDPEIMDTLELVLMKWGSNWKGNLVFFENRWKETIVLQSITNTLRTYENGGRSRAHGVEASLLWLPHPWIVDFNIAYTESRNEETGEDYELFPRVITNLEVGYAWVEHGLDIALINRVFTGAKQRVATLTPDLEDMPTYWRADLSLNKSFGEDIDVFLNVINLFDRDNYLPSVGGMVNSFPDVPISFSVGGQIRF